MNWRPGRARRLHRCLAAQSDVRVQRALRGAVKRAPDLAVAGELPDDYQTTADVPLPTRLVDQVIGQEKGVEIVRLAARQQRFLLMVGEPGTGKSMLAAAMAELMPAHAQLVRFVAQEVARDGGIPHFRRDAVEAIIEEARLRSGRPDRLTVRLRELGGLVRAAGDLAATEGATLVELRHVLAARDNTRTMEEQIARQHQAQAPGAVTVGSSQSVPSAGTAGAPAAHWPPTLAPPL